MYLLVKSISRVDNEKHTTKEEIYKANTISELKLVFDNLMTLYKVKGFDMNYNESLMVIGYKDDEHIKLQCFTSIW